MLRYLTLAWDVTNPNACHTAETLQRTLGSSIEEWHTGTQTHGLSVHYKGTTPSAHEVTLLPNDAGIILGTLYRRRSEGAESTLLQPPVLNERDLHRICSSKGHSLVNEYWGSYVLFQRVQASPQYVCAYRGPMSDLACFYTRYRGVYIFFPFLSDALSLGIGPLTPNFSLVRAAVVYGDPRTHETSLNEVQSVDVGECVTVCGDRLTRERYWHPGKIACNEPISKLPEAIRELRAVTLHCVHSMVARHSSALLLLSGGNDSSILAACLSMAPNDIHVTAVNYAFADSIGAEEKYARASATQCGFRLIERPRRTFNLQELHSISSTPSPHVYFGGSSTYRDAVSIAKNQGDTAIFSGAMGDTIFGRGETSLAIADYVQRWGFRPGLLRVAYNVALRERLCMWRILPPAIQMGWLNSPKGPWSQYRHEQSQAHFRVHMRERLLSQEAIDGYESELTRFIHPWLQQAESIPIGKLLTLSVLTLEMPGDNPFIDPDDPTICRPFTAQPEVETSLRITSDLNVAEGWDRAVARMAFARDLPPENVRRRTKGSPLRSLREVVDQNVAFIREFLLDGILVKEKLLDPKLIEAALPGSVTSTPVGITGLTEHLYTEAWLRHWLSRAPISAT